MIIALVDHNRRLQFSEETKALATKLYYKKNSEKKIPKGFLRDHHQLRLQRKIVEKIFAITVAQQARIKNRAIFSFLLTKNRQDGSHLLEKSIC